MAIPEIRQNTVNSFVRLVNFSNFRVSLYVAGFENPNIWGLFKLGYMGLVNCVYSVRVIKPAIVGCDT